MRGKLTRITDNGHTRTSEMIGEFAQPPTLDCSFQIINDQPLVEGQGFTNRMITTSPVQNISPLSNGKGWRFWTLNTEYTLEAV